MLNPSAEHLANQGRFIAACIDFDAIRGLTISAPEQDLVQDASWRKREEACDHEGSTEQADHRLAMALHRMAVRLPEAEREHCEREDRQEVDGAPWSPQSDLVHPKRAEVRAQADSWGDLATTGLASLVACTT